MGGIKASPISNTFSLNPQDILLCAQEVSSSSREGLLKHLKINRGKAKVALFVFAKGLAESPRLPVQKRGIYLTRHEVSQLTYHECPLRKGNHVGENQRTLKKR